MSDIKIAVYKSDEVSAQGEHTQLSLNNGDIIILEEAKKYSHYYMVTTYGDGKSNMCAFTDLKTGARAFTEPASRSTTIGRVLNHLRMNFGASTYAQFRQYKAGEYIMNIELFGDGIIKRRSEYGDC
jgi:hypothetical protein